MKKWSIGNLWKKYKYVGLVVLAGIVLMVLPAGKSAPDPQKDSSGFSLEDTERRMEELLGRMDGESSRVCSSPAPTMAMPAVSRIIKLISTARMRWYDCFFIRNAPPHVSTMIVCAPSAVYSHRISAIRSQACPSP